MCQSLRCSVYLTSGLLARTDIQYHEVKLHPRFTKGVTLYLFLSEDNSAQQLILQTPHGNSEVDDGCPCADLGSVCWVGELGGNVETEALHYVHLLISHFYLITVKIKMRVQSFIDPKTEKTHQSMTDFRKTFVEKC